MPMDICTDNIFLEREGGGARLEARDEKRWPSMDTLLVVDDVMLCMI